MPFLIKSSGGQRTCKLLTNKNQNSTREDIVEALKGLTFKFEVKIVDVVSSETGEVQNKKVDTSLFSNNEELVESQREVAAHNNLTQIPETSTNSHKIHDLTQVSPTPAVVEQAPTKIEVSASEFERQEPAQTLAMVNDVRMIPRSVEMKVAPRNGDFNAARPTDQKKRYEAEQTEVLVKDNGTRLKSLDDSQTSVRDLGGARIQASSKIAPKLPLIRGEMRVGSIVTTCCVSMDESVNPPVTFVTYDNEKLLDITKLIMEMSEGIEDLSEVERLDYGDIVFAKSQDDDSWYRAIVEKVEEASVMVYFFDWGIRERLNIRRVRCMSHPDLGLSLYPACASKVKFTNQKGPLLEEALKCEGEFNMKIESYDDNIETYTATIIST